MQFLYPQRNTLPTGSADFVGVCFQYMGSTSGNLIHGHFYECVGSGGSYLWKEVSLESYLSTERVVGYWIDGKPVYQKTLTGTFNRTESGNASQELSHGISNLKWCIDMDVMYHWRTGQSDQESSSCDPYVDIWGNQENCWVVVYKSVITFYLTKAANWKGATFTIILRYTKTTD